MTDPVWEGIPSLQEREVLRAAAKGVLDTPSGPLREAAIRFAARIAQAVLLDGRDHGEVARAMGIDPGTLTDWIASIREPKPRHPVPQNTRENLDPPLRPPPSGEFSTTISQYATINFNATSYSTSSQTINADFRPRLVQALLFLSGDSRKCRNAFDVEAGDLRELIDPAPQFRWEERVSVRLGGIAPEMTSHRPAILHLSGHLEHGGLLLTELARNSWFLLPIDALIDQLTRNHRPRLAVLNICNSIDFARQLVVKTEAAAIAWEGELSDNDATRFNRYFYHRLVLGHTIAESLGTALDATAWYGCEPRAIGTPKALNQRFPQ